MRDLKSWFLSFLFLVACFSIPLVSVAGQEESSSKEERAEMARENIKALKEGALIVRFPSYQSKIDALENILGSTGPDNPNRKRVEKQLEQTLADRKEFNQNIMSAFREVYNFSEVYFMLDTATAALKTGRLQGFLLNSALEADPSIRLGDPPYFILRFGSTSDMTTDGVEAMVVMNGQFEDLDKPFPYYQRLHDFAAVMGSIFPVQDQKKKDALRIVGKLNEKLKEYYLDVRRMEGL